MGTGDNPESSSSGIPSPVTIILRTRFAFTTWYLIVSSWLIGSNQLTLARHEAFFTSSRSRRFGILTAMEVRISWPRLTKSGPTRHSHVQYFSNQTALAKYRLTPLIGRPNLTRVKRSNIADRSFYTKPVHVTDAIGHKGFRSYAADDFVVRPAGNGGVFGLAQPLVIAAFRVQAESNADTGTVQVLGWQLYFGGSTAPLVVGCSSLSERPFLVRPRSSEAAIASYASKYVASVRS